MRLETGLAAAVLALGWAGGGAAFAVEEGGEAPAAEEAGANPRPEARILRLSLQESVELALRNNLELRVSSYDPSLAAADLDEAEALYEHLFTARVEGGERRTPQWNTRTLPSSGTTVRTIDGSSQDLLISSMGVSRLLPTGANLSFEASIDRTITNTLFLADNPFYETRVGLHLRQPLLRGFGRDVTEAGVRYARDSRDFADMAFRSRTEDLVRRVEASYWFLVNVRGDLESRRQSVAVAEELLRINRARLDAGAGTRVEVSQAEAGMAARHVEQLRSENALRIGEENLLGLLLPRNPDAPSGGPTQIEPSDDPYRDLPPLPAEDVESAVQEALLARSDVRSLRVFVDQAEASVVTAKSEAQVRLDLTASVAYSGMDGTLGESYGESLLTREFPTWSVGLVLEVPLGNRAARARLLRATLQRARAEAQVRARESDIAVQVRNSRRDLESAREQIDAAVRSRELAEEQLRAEKERLRNDKSTTFEVLRLESDLSDARRSELRSLADYRTAIARYDFEVGRILERRGLAPPKPAR